MDAFTHMKMAGYLKLAVINPLHERLPKLVLVLQATCNQFSASMVAKQWTEMQRLFDVHLAPVFGYGLLGHASDGDSRRISLQWRQMATVPAADRFRLDSNMIGLGGRWVQRATKPVGSAGASNPVREVTGLHNQDPIHVLKLLWNSISIPSHQLQIGDYALSHSHVVASIAQSGMRAEDEQYDPRLSAQCGVGPEELQREDRQNFEAVQKFVSQSAENAVRSKDPNFAGTAAVPISCAQASHGMFIFTFARCQLFLIFTKHTFLFLYFVLTVAGLFR